ncbi:aminodeoxychorismate synthase component I [Gilliamella sp. ESL0405]|uniref:aminodeoxychorismate synthase component I n=1 Tax=Gilliamella sp. ESL0405 TaxID=2704653 RepID=UPI001C69BDDA|nr:aminodeoxychorismate synthase component I [Gilliamella sp. ESL0405]QYN47402.1 aminodeoxychorismate synthase component I [Gilliamella sp. ESL0405]
MKIYIDFEGERRYFCDPIKIVKTDNPNAIKQQIDEIEKFTDQGYYAVGYLAYESATGFNLAMKTKSPCKHDAPLVLFGIFDGYSTQQPPYFDDYTPPAFDLVSDTKIDQYQQKIDYIRQQIASGNTYQTNYTIKLTAPFNDKPIDYYHFLQKNNHAGYCAYIEFDNYCILSISPELFFKLDKQTITTKPMKGTTPRGMSYQHDEQQLALLMSDKNQAENMMIVDLLRNDLSQISKPGTVHVPKLFTAEKYPTVWQLTSTVEGQLKPQTNLYQIFQALFPCGSITGAPKTSTMQIIANIENSARGVYCGTIGYIEPLKNKAIFNIPIRTLTIHDGQLHYGVGGGITWDSTSQDEYDEVLAKSAILTRTACTPDAIIESLLLENGQIWLPDEHLTRLTQSAHYFDFNCDITNINQQLAQIANSYAQGRYKLRIEQPAQGNALITIDAISAPMQINKLVFAPQCVNSNNVYLYHKTSNRHHFPTLTTGKEYINFNQNDEITEFVNGNIVVLINQQWFTPKISSGLLPGTMRQYYLDNQKILEKTISKNELLQAEKIAFINSVRKWVEIDNSVFEEFKKAYR